MVDVNQVVNQAASGGGMGQRSAREVEVLLSADSGPFQEEMKKAGTAAGSVADALHEVEKAYVSALRKIGGAGLGIGAALTASAGAAATAAASFEESFARVAKTTGLENQFGQFAATLGIGSNALQEFANDIRLLSTELPVPVQELAHLADVAGTLGVESEHLARFAETAATLGAAINEIGSTQAIAGLANLMGAFGDAPETVDNLASSLAELSNKTRGSADEMLMFSNRLAGTAVQVGMTSEEVLALGAAVSAIGAQPELGASAIIQFFTRLSTAVQTGGEDMRRFADVMGMTTEQLREMWAMEGATGVLFEFLSTLSEQGEGAAVSLQKVGLQGTATTQVLGGLAAQLDVTAEALNISNEAYEEGVAASELAAVRFDTVVKSLLRMRNAIAEVVRSLGQPFLAPMKQVIDAFTWLINIFNKLAQPIKSVLGLILGLTGPLVTLAGVAVLLFAKFHVFFMLLHTFQVILPMVSAGFLKLAASLEALQAMKAADHSMKLALAFERLGVILADLPEAARQFALLIGEHSLRAAETFRRAWARAGGVSQELIARLSSIGVVAREAGARAVAALRGLGAQFMALVGLARASVGAMLTQLGGIPAATRMAAASILSSLRGALSVVAASARASFGVIVAQLGTIPAQARVAGMALLTQLQTAMVALGNASRVALGMVVAQLARIPIEARAVAAHLGTQLVAGLRTAATMARTAISTVVAQISTIPGAARFAANVLVGRLGAAFSMVGALAQAGLAQAVAFFQAIPAAAAAASATMLAHMRAAFASLVATSRAAVFQVIASLGTLGATARAVGATIATSLQAGLVAAMRGYGVAIAGLIASLTTVGKVARVTGVALLTHLRAGFMAVGNAALWASRKVLGFAAAETLHGMRTMVGFLGTLTRGFSGLAGAIGKAAGAKLLLLAPFIKFIAIAAALAAVVSGIVWLWRKFTGETEEVVGTMEELATATTGSYQSLEKLGSTLEEVTPKSIDFARAASDMVGHLQDLVAAGDEAAARDYIMRYGMLLMAQGVDPETIQVQVEELARLADVPIVFTYTMQEMAQGEGFEERLHIAASGVSDLIDELQDEMAPSAIRQTIWFGAQSFSEEFEEGLSNYIDVIKDTVDKNEAARLVALRELETSLVDAFEEGDVSRRQFEKVVTELREQGIVQEEDVGWMKRQWREAALSPMRDEWAEDIARILEDATLVGSDEFNRIASAVRNVTGETQDLGDAVRNLTDDEAQRLHEEFIRIADEVHARKLGIPEAENAINNLHAAWLGSAEGIGDNEEKVQRYRKHIEELWPQMMGHEAALRQAQHMLDQLVDAEQEYTEEWEFAVNLVKRWGEEVNRQRIADLSEQLNALTAADQVRVLTAEIQRLDASIPQERELGQELLGMRSDAMRQAEGEFRQTMSNYDSLMDQQAQMVEDHNRRMERMAEDHNRRMADMRKQRDRSIEDANKSLADRLEDIAEREQELLDQRVESVSEAFQIMERIQSRPSASMGALAQNMEVQNRVMEEMGSNVHQLRRMGLDEEVMEALGFDDPRNFAQVQRMLSEALSDPGMIAEINRQWARRTKVGETFVREVEAADVGDTIAEEMDEARQDAIEAHDEQVADIRRRYNEQVSRANEDYARQVADAEENHTRQMNGIAERLAELGDRSVEEIGDLMERAIATEIEGIKTMAEELDDIMALMALGLQAGLDNLEEVMGSGFDNIFTGLKGLASGLRESLSGDWGQLIEGVGASGAVNFLSDLTEYAVEQADEQRSTSITPTSTAYGYQMGGEVPGSGREDSVPALLTPGEFVMNPDAVERYGVEFFEQLNAQQFARGGMVHDHDVFVRLANGGRVSAPSRRGAEYGGGQDLVGALTKALENANIGHRSETNFGPITVKAQDVNQMLRELEQRERVKRLTNRELAER